MINPHFPGTKEHRLEILRNATRAYCHPDTEARLIEQLAAIEAAGVKLMVTIPGAITTDSGLARDVISFVDERLLMTAISLAKCGECGRAYDLALPRCPVCTREDSSE